MATIWGKSLQAGALGLSGISSAISGFQNASLLEEQGALTKDDYYRQAALVKEEGFRTRSKQTMEYISSGVEIVGTPQLVLKETLSKSFAKANSLEVTGRNYERLYNKKAKQSESEGMTSLISSIVMGGALFL
jgi:hypothetical protein